MATTTKAKEIACKTFKVYLELIYNLGKGIMFNTQIEQYMHRIYGRNATKVRADLQELKSKDLIEIKKWHNNNFIKLKKYSIAYLNHTSTDKIKSVDVSTTKLVKTAFINQYILDTYNIDKAEELGYLISHLISKTTLLNKKNDNAQILKNTSKYKDVTLNLQEEVRNLEELQQVHLDALRTKVVQRDVRKNNKFNLNNMSSRSIYIREIKEDKIDVVLLDLKNTLTEKILYFNLLETYMYLITIFNRTDLTRQLPLIDINFTILTKDIEAFERVYKLQKQVDKRLKQARLFKYTIDVIDLDLTKKVFNNVKVLI